MSPKAKKKKASQKKQEQKMELAEGQKKFVILHSNDMHGDFLAEVRGQEGHLIGGIALLSGYINKVRREEENVLFVISGDMFQGSLIDSEYKGISTMELMNYLAPDVVALGNHEFDYGLSHLLFLEKIANFPIVNANLYIKKYNKRLMRPYLIIEQAGLHMLFTGILTEKVMADISRDQLGSFMTVKEAADEVKRITDAYKGDDIDLTVLLTHIGFESDKELAKILDPECGVDLMIGGHSHTILEAPEDINHILITQAGVGTDQIGRFDIVVDDATNSIVEYKWQLIPINDEIAEPDQHLMEFINTFQSAIDRKYSVLLCKFARELTHPRRTEETTLGDLFADAFAEIAACDVMLVGSGSIRSKTLGPIVTLRDFRATFPYDDILEKFYITGSMLRKIFTHIMRIDNRNDEGECYQINDRIKAVYNDETGKLESLKFDDKPVGASKLYTLGLQGYHVDNAEANLGVTADALRKKKRSHIVSRAMQVALEEYLTYRQNIDRKIEGRLVFKFS
jgi:5'-nucleotidase/UDP-sugar diphosphatase